MDIPSRTVSPSENTEDSLYNKIVTNSKLLDKMEDEAGEIARSVQHIHAQIRSMGGFDEKMVSELRALYEKGLEQARREEDLASNVSSQIDQFMQLKGGTANTRNETATQGSSTPTSSSASPHRTPQSTSKPVKKTLTQRKPTTSQLSAAEEGNAPSSPASLKRMRLNVIFLIRNSNIPIPKNDARLLKGRAVAAKEPKTRNEEENYIIATIKGYNPQTKQYEVEDADETAPERIFWVPQNNIIPIPKKETILTEFPARHTVLAVYPATTTFYKAVVVLPPSKTVDRPNSDEKGKYLLEFEDDGGAKRPADIIHVLEYPKQH
ncbi:1327_t:CDS:2 [Ambispora leptoticha]|uniref:1327_t:CDS:1 n=1 Tax=Ambispora leptoticha TaxID=144679 RepID=A0A9N8V176_9GLOM|nr:1327_t:CDS:2 [Ambispora leptoticha]